MRSSGREQNGPLSFNILILLRPQKCHPERLLVSNYDSTRLGKVYAENTFRVSTKMFPFNQNTQVAKKSDRRELSMRGCRFLSISFLAWYVASGTLNV